MKWRVISELIGPDATVGVHEVGGRPGWPKATGVAGAQRA
jgi:hypothetical protein